MLFFEISELEWMVAGRPRGLLRGGGGPISSLKRPRPLSEALEMLRKLHLYTSTEQPQLHNLISDLASQLTDIYLESKAVKQSSIKDYFPCA